MYIDDVANGLIAAREDGRNGERYILSGGGISLGDFFEELSDVSGKRPPRWTVPDRLAGAALRAMALAAPITRRRAPSPIGSMGGGGPIYDGGKAARELGVEYTPLRVGLEATVRWYRQGKPESWSGLA